MPPSVQSTSNSKFESRSYSGGSIIPCALHVKLILCPDGTLSSSVSVVERKAGGLIWDRV